MNRKVFNLSKKERILEKFSGHCAYCGEKVSVLTFTVDHVKPLAHGGGNTFENLYPACHDCNCIKGSLGIEDFRQKVSKILSKAPISAIEKRTKKKFAAFSVDALPKFFFETFNGTKKQKKKNFHGEKK